MRQQPSKPAPLMSPGKLRAFLRERRKEHSNPPPAMAAASGPNDWDIEVLAAEAEMRRASWLEPKCRPIIDAQTGRPLNEPLLLMSLERHERSLELLFEGMRYHYLHCIASGRLDVWKKAGHALIELCGSVPEAEITERSMLQ